MRGEQQSGSNGRWRVGALSRATGLSVRTLRHYDAIGLVRPAQRTASGYREYSGDDIRRLYRVLTLRRLGLSLEEIRAALEGAPEDLLGVVERQIERVDLEIRMAGELRTRLASLAEVLRQPATAPFAELRDVLEVMAMTNRYYTPEQLEQLERRAEELGPEGMQAAQEAWAAVIADAESARRRGLDPTSEEVRAISRRWQELVEQFTGGDAGIRASLQRMYETEGTEAASRGTVSSELMEYMRGAERPAS
jgi:DNA-binding transcriptional MerR regulator